VFEIGGSYRVDEAFTVMTNFTIAEKLIIGYAYDMSTRSELGSAKNTNELLFRYKFN